MARDFTKDTANRLHLSGNPIGPLFDGASRLSLAALVRGRTFDGPGLHVNLIAQSFREEQLALSFGVRDAQDLRLSIRSQLDETLKGAQSSTTIAPDMWTHVGVEADLQQGAISFWIDGVPAGVSAEAFDSPTYQNLGNPTRFDRIGAGGALVESLTPILQWDGLIEFLALWRDIDVGAAGYFAAIAGGDHPIATDPAFLMVLGYETPDRDLMGSGVVSVITGDVPFVEGPVGLPEPDEWPAAGLSPTPDLVTWLQGDAWLASLAPGGVWEDPAPDVMAVFVGVSLLPGSTAIRCGGGDYTLDCTFEITGVAPVTQDRTQIARCRAVQERIQDLVHAQPVTLPGWQQTAPQLEGLIERTQAEVLTGTRWILRGGRYRWRLTPAL